METKNILSGPSKARILDSFCTAFSPAKTEVSFEIENTDGSKLTYVGVITKLEHEDGSGNSFNFAGNFKNYGFVKGWYNTHKRTGFIIV